MRGEASIAFSTASEQADWHWRWSIGHAFVNIMTITITPLWLVKRYERMGLDRLRIYILRDSHLIITG